MNNQAPLNVTQPEDPFKVYWLPATANWLTHWPVLPSIRPRGKFALQELAIFGGGILRTSPDRKGFLMERDRFLRTGR
ncbi:hypothetical protein [Rhizobium laguerreae]|uniref:hypothetical protein n=1 Tax=Rhizobium laguerreae TaxID=1076926 RepID=UPI001C9129B9|nr:hypothetical protein [Rhizobium laguerreae]MBY3347974.1 hypothetical protein [Rhizobium laguerreae]MBY3354937.1 hypothetical protein [Rhizobium laguerreae]MBY3376242.1 hypothetical protein [Rhizobium laguerreae]MBY3431241.1 hypothetical protein [Rhizobium laguerreae]MBY3439857.1 hypothetical protein [Rhizobium laguerreae]